MTQTRYLSEAIYGTSPGSMPGHTMRIERVAYSVVETLELLSVGRTTLYALVKSGDLRATKCGRKTLFLASDIIAFIERLRSGEAA